MTTMQMSALNSNLGGVIQGQFGNYEPDANGNFFADTRDVASLLAAGCQFLRKASEWMTLPTAPIAAAVAQIVATASLSSGALTIANQPDVMRQVSVNWYPGTSAITAGALTASYLANDGQGQIDTISLVAAASGTPSAFLTKGVAHIRTLTVSAITGGASPGIELGVTSALALAVDPGCQGTPVLTKENDTGTDQSTLGTFVTWTTTLACVTPNNVPNATRTYAWAYTYLAPIV